MESIKTDFDKISIKKFHCMEGTRYFDPIRNVFVNITPEETVRQKMILYMQNKMMIPHENIGVEEHITHFGVRDYNGRMDVVVKYLDSSEEKVLCVIECKGERIFIQSTQAKEQARKYAEMVNAKFFGLVNGIDIYFFHKNYDGIYCEIEGIPTFEEMKKDVYIEMSECPVFQRLNYNEYFDLNFLESQDWFSYKIGDDTDGDLIPCIIALDDCLLDFSQQLTKIESSRFEIIEDLGIQFRQYGDASDSDFGSGEYRVFMMNDKLLHQQFLVGFTISATGKTFNDPKYGNSSGKSVLVLMYNNGSVDETPAQINLNQFLKVDNEKKIMKIIHNGATHRKGAKKQDLLEYVKQFNENLVKNNQIEFGSVDFSKPLYFKNEDVKYLFTNLIEYCVYREEYKICLSNKK